MIQGNQSNDIKRLQRALEKKLGWGPVSKWHSSMFDELAEKVFTAAQVKLSTATLKRFFGVVNHDGDPSSTTLDVLSQFAGYENWRSFKQSKRKPFQDIGKNISGNTIYLSMGFFIALVTIMLISNKRPEPVEVPEDIVFTSRPVTKSYPNSVVFDFDLKNMKADSMHIQQYWDVTKTISIDRAQKQATGIYYFPGYFRAKLVVNGQPIKEHDLFLKSNGWLGTIDYEPVPKYFTPKFGDDVALACPDDLVNEVSQSDKPLISVYHYIDDLGNVSGDNFNLKASIRNTFDDKWAVCHSAWIFIIGTKGAMIVPFSKAGCSSNNSLMINDFYLNGKEHDLSAFGTNLSDFAQVEIAVENKSVSFFIHGEKVFHATYNDSVGRLVGLRFKFLGLGEVESFSLVDQTNKRVSL